MISLPLRFLASLPYFPPSSLSHLMIKHRDKSPCLIIKNRSSFPRRRARFRKHHIKSTVMREDSLPSSLCELSLAPHPVKKTITALRSSAILAVRSNCSLRTQYRASANSPEHNCPSNINYFSPTIFLPVSIVPLSPTARKTPSP